jgi:uncharacterized protein YkuJ
LPLSKVSTTPIAYQNSTYPTKYRKSIGGVGLPVGEFLGPTYGNFNKRVAFYNCWNVDATNSNTIKERALDADTGDNMVIPCGFVRSATGGQHSLSETGQAPKRLRDFAINGELFKPVSFHVTENCICRFYRSVQCQSDSCVGFEDIDLALP